MPVKTWDELVVKAARQCLKEKLSDQYADRLKHELEEIGKQGANSYWLRLYNSGKKFDDNKNGLIFPFLIGVTTVDPIKANIDHIIKFDPEFPDIDVDLLPMSRDHIKKYAEEKYGQEHVCNVGLWLTYKAKLAMQDAATVLGHNRHEVIAVCKTLPEEFDEMPFEQAYEEFEELRGLYDSKPEIVELAYKLMGKIKSQGKHAGGLIISDVPVRDYIPLTLCGSDKNKQWTSAWTEGMAASQLSKFGFIKFDLLGLLNISYIYNCKRLIRKNRDIIVNFDDIDPQEDKAGWICYPDGVTDKIRLNDPEALDQADKIKLESVFQFDTDFAKSIVDKGGVKSFNDLMIYTSLGRPGPLPMIDVYIKNRDDKDEAWRGKLHPKMLDILEETKGVLCFQEQLLRIWVEVCGFTMPEAEAAQKAVKKKRIAILNEIEPQVIEGAAPVLGRDVAQKLWDQMVSFGRYCFNKCLSADTVVVNPITGQSIAIEKLYQTKQSFKLLAYDGYKTFVDDVVDIHYNGKQMVLEVEFSNGIKQTVTEGHRFLNELGEMEEVKSLVRSGHAIKYISGDVTDVSENKRPNRISNRRTLQETENLQPNFSRSKRKDKPWHNNQSHKKTRSEEKIFNKGVQHSRSPLLRKHKHARESLLARDVDSRWIYPRGEKRSKLTTSIERPKLSKSIWERYQISEENANLPKRELQTSSPSCKQQQNGSRLESAWGCSGEINRRNHPKYSIYITPTKRADGWGWVHHSQLERIPDGQNRIKLRLLRQIENDFSVGVWRKPVQNYKISKQFSRNLLDWFTTSARYIKIPLQRRNKISIKEEANGRCYIISVKELGVKKTYSPEMASKHHNYITTPRNGEVIHANSHGAAYTIIAYRCLWLKTHFPEEWWAAVLSECPNTRMVQYMGAARSEKIKFGPINVNSLTTGFSVDGDKVTPGVMSVKGIGKTVAKALVDISEQGPFADLDDFVQRVGKNKTATERLVKLGGFDSFYKNRRALWMWYVYKYDTTTEANKFRKKVNNCYVWQPDKVDAERARQVVEYQRLYPKRKKIPGKISKWVPSTPRAGEPDPYDPEVVLDAEQIKMAKKIKLKFGDVVKLFPKNYNLKKLLQFEKEYLGYYWNSPVDMFIHGTKTTIEHAKQSGFLECVIEESYVRQGARGEYMILNVTDGISAARVNVWGNEVLSNDEEVFNVGNGIKMRVSWQEKWRSFAAKRGSIVMPLPLRDEE